MYRIHTGNSKRYAFDCMEVGAGVFEVQLITPVP
jgi:hypothetical protein